MSSENLRPGRQVNAVGLEASGESFGNTGIVTCHLEKRIKI